MNRNFWNWQKHSSAISIKPVIPVSAVTNSIMLYMKKELFINDILINYLNENWQEEDGGQLCLYNDTKKVSVAPQSKTAVFFKSDELEHEVELCTKTRMSISGWLKRG